MVSGWHGPCQQIRATGPFHNHDTDCLPRTGLHSLDADTKRAKHTCVSSMCVDIYIYMHVICMYIYIYTIQLYIGICVYIYIYVRTYVYIYVGLRQRV